MAEHFAAIHAQMADGFCGAWTTVDIQQIFIAAIRADARGNGHARAAFMGGRRKIGLGIQPPPGLKHQRLAATLGAFLRFLEERLPWAGLLATRFVQGAWNLATVFAVVNIVDGQAKTGVEAAKKSVQQLTTAFGENITVRVGIGAISGIFVLLWLVVVIIGLPVLLTIYLENLLIAGSVAFVGVIVLLMALFFISVLESVLSVMLYEYTLHGNETAVIEKELFKQMISTKKARSVFSHG